MGLFGKFEKHHKKDPMQRVLEGLHGCIETKDEIRDEMIFCPEWNITIRPEIDQLDQQMAVLNFYVSSPDWEEPLFECCAGTGRDTDTAIGTATGSFLFAFMQGIALMQRGEDGTAFESSFAGHTHRWSVYKSNVVGIGEKTGDDDDAKEVTARYWELLKDHIAKRLGNQKMCYVKIYAAKAVGADGEHITGECRINDVPSEELGALVGKLAAKWNVQQFASQKQFFFIKQDPATVLPYPYSDAKIPTLSVMVKRALDIFAEVKTQEQYEQLFDKLNEAIGDETLAWECLSFLPEICAERAFGKLTFSEELLFSFGDNSTAVYKNQLADFYPLGNLMFSLFDSGIFGERTNDLYRSMIGMSSIYSAVEKLSENGAAPEGRISALIFNTPPGFEIR